MQSRFGWNGNFDVAGGCYPYSGGWYELGRILGCTRQMDFDAVAALSIELILSLSSDQSWAANGEVFNGFEIQLSLGRGLIAGLSGWAPPNACGTFGAG